MEQDAKIVSKGVPKTFCCLNVPTEADDHVHWKPLVTTHYKGQVEKVYVSHCPLSSIAYGHSPQSDPSHILVIQVLSANKLPLPK